MRLNSPKYNRFVRYRCIRGSSTIIRCESRNPISADYGSLTPAALGFVRWSEAATGGTTQENSYLTYGASLEGNLYFDKSSDNGFVHEIVPRAKMMIREPDKEPTVIKFDTLISANDTVTVSQIFLDNPISGGDFVGDTRELALALTSRGVNLEGVEAYRITAGRTFLSGPRSHIIRHTETTDQGPLIFESTIRPTKSFDWNIRFHPVADGETMDRATNEIKYKASDTIISHSEPFGIMKTLSRTDFYLSGKSAKNGDFLRGFSGSQVQKNGSTKLSEQSMRAAAGVQRWFMLTSVIE